MEPWTIIEGGTLGIADGDETPEPLSGVLVITPRFASLSTETGFIVTGPIYVPVTDGVIPEIHVPAVEDGTALVEFRLKGQLCGPVEFPDTEIPVEPGTTIRLSDYIPRGVDPGTGGILVPGPPGPPGRGVVSIADDDGDGTATVTYSDGTTDTLALPQGGGGSGIEEVSGTVVLDPDGPRIREFYTVGVTTIGGEDFAPDTALAVRRLASGAHEVAVVGEVGGWRAFGEEPSEPEPGDTAPPTAGTMAVMVTEDSITGTVSGAMDETALHDEPYRFSLDGEWSEWQASAEYVWEGLAPGTEYEAQHEVRDAAGNTKLGAAVATATTAVPEWTVLAEETFTGVPDGPFPDGRTIPGAAGLTWELTGDWGVPIVGERIDFAPEDNATFHTIAARRATSTMNDVRLSAEYTCPTGTRRHGASLILGIDLNEPGTVARSVNVGTTSKDLTVNGVSGPESGTITVHWSPRNKLRRVLVNGEEILSEVHTGGFAAAFGMSVRLNRGAFTVDNIRYEEAVL